MLDVSGWTFPRSFWGYQPPPTHPARGDDLHHRCRLGSETTAAPRWGAETWNRKTDKNGGFGVFYRDSGWSKTQYNGILGDSTTPVV